MKKEKSENKMAEVKSIQRMYDWKMLFCGSNICDLSEYYEDNENSILDLKPFFGFNIFPKYIALKNNIPVKLSIWDVDLDGESYDSKKDYIRGCMGALIIADSSNK